MPRHLLSICICLTLAWLSGCAHCRARTRLALAVVAANHVVALLWALPNTWSFSLRPASRCPAQFTVAFRGRSAASPAQPSVQSLVLGAVEIINPELTPEHAGSLPQSGSDHEAVLGDGFRYRCVLTGTAHVSV